MPRLQSGVILMSGLGLDHEIKRIGDDYYNFVHPTRKAEVTSVNTNTVNVYIESLEYGYEDVPILKPCYKESGITFTLDLVIGDYVLVAFVNGHSGDPIIIGKY